MVSLPSGVVTFVLTAIAAPAAGSEHMAAAMATSLVRQARTVARAMSSSSGTVIESSGEGTLAVFTLAQDALLAAHRVRQAFAVERWPTGAAIDARIGVHTGDAVDGDGRDAGPAIDRVTELCGGARRGEVLVCGETAAAARDALPPGCELLESQPGAPGGGERREMRFTMVVGSGGTVPSRLRTTVAGGRRGDGVVSQREHEVLSLVCEHLANAEIATRLYISERTVESHVTSLLRKCGARDRHELVRMQGQHERALSSRAAARKRSALPPMLELLADSSTFVGRRAERQLLRESWQVARAGPALVVVLSGEAGVGKSRLVAELARDVAANGGRVLLGASYEDFDQPYGPFAQIIAADAADLAAPEIARRVADDRAVLTRLVPGLAREAAVEPVAGRRDAEEWERELLLDSIERWLAASASASPLLVVIEDLHWSSSSTRDALRHLVRRAALQRSLIVMTTRDGPPDLDVDTSMLLADLIRSPAVTAVPLGGLGLDEVAALIGGDLIAAEAIVAETGGNPLLVKHMTEVGQGGSIAALLSRREGRLDDDTRALLDLAATFGCEFDADLLAIGAGVPLMTVLEALEQAAAAGLVVSLPDGGASFGFVHALFRSHRYRALPLRRRLEAHAAAATALASRPGDDRLASERARHACLAVPVGDARAAVDLACRAAHLAERTYAYDEAASHYRRALGVASSLDGPAQRVALDLTVRLAAALHHHGSPKGLSMLLDAADEARATRDDAALVRVAVSFSHFGSAGAFGRPAYAQLAVIEDALAVIGTAPSATRAHLLIELAVQIAGVRVDESIALARDAEAIARHIGDDELLGVVLLGARHIGRHPRRMAEYERIGLELERLGAKLRSLALSLGAVSVQMMTHLERGDLRGWREAHEHFLRLLGDRPLTSFQLTSDVNSASRAVLDGRFDDAEDLARTLGRTADTLGYSRAAYSGPIMLIVRRLQGRDSELLDGLERIVQHAGDVFVYRCSLAAVRARAGELADARRSLEALRGDRGSFPQGNTWAVAMAELAEAAEVAGDAETAAHVLAELSPYSGAIAATATGVNRPLDQALAQAALAVDDATLAEGHARRAVSASRRRNTPVYLARELVFLAEAHRRASASKRSVRSLVDEARSVAESVGVHAVRDDLRRYGLTDS